ncbi:MAG: hypothetical protein IKJ63_09675 [Clostridia bacterium]|nr:hypothetical protein [Clostridia bacterium]MBR3955727.1 hypothetical protein [Clostridia bacterium]
MNFKFEDLFDFTASTGDWVDVIRAFITAIADFLKFIGIDLFAPSENGSATGNEDAAV